LEANVSGKDVPKATIVTAVIVSGIAKTHPNKTAAFSIIIVHPAVPSRAMKKQGIPP
jgi:hypothetical protein